MDYKAHKEQGAHGGSGESSIDAMSSCLGMVDRA